MVMIDVCALPAVKAEEHRDERPRPVDGGCRRTGRGHLPLVQRSAERLRSLLPRCARCRCSPLFRDIGCACEDGAQQQEDFCSRSRFVDRLAFRV